MLPLQTGYTETIEMSCQRLQFVSVCHYSEGEPQEKAHMFVIDFVMYYFEITVEK